MQDATPETQLEPQTLGQVGEHTQGQVAAHPHASLGSRFVTGAFWSLVGTGAVYAAQMVAAIIAARMLGKVIYGEFGMINSTIATIGEFAGLGLGLTATKHVAELRKSDPGRAGRILGLSIGTALGSGLLLTFIFLAFAPQVALHPLGAPHLAGILRVASALLVLNTLCGVIGGALSGLEAFKSIAAVNTARGILNFPLLIIGVRLFGLVGAVGAAVMVSLLGLYLSYRALTRELGRTGVRLRFRGAASELPVFWKFALPAFLSSVVVPFSVWIANAILVNQRGGYGEMGILNATNQWKAALTFLPQAALQVSLPLMASSLGDGVGNKQFGRLLEVTQSVAVAVVLPLSAGLMFASEWIVRLYGKAFADGATVMVMMMCAVMIGSTASATGPAIQARGRMWLGFAINLGWSASLACTVWFTVHRFGASSVALGQAVAAGLTVIATYCYLYRDVPKGLILRAGMTLCYVILLTWGCLIVPVGMRVPLAVPVALFTAFCTVTVFTSSDVRESALRRFGLRGGMRESGTVVTLDDLSTCECAPEDSGALSGVRVALVSVSMCCGGVESGMLRLGRFLKTSGADVDIVTTAERGEWFDQIERWGLGARHISGWHPYRHSRRVAHELSVYDVVVLDHAPFAQAAIGMMPDDVIIIPVVHNDADWVYQVACVGNSGWNVAVAVSRPVQDKMRELTSRPVEVIYPIVNPPDEAAYRTRIAFSTPLRLVYVGRIDQSQKGVFYLPDILRGCIDRGIDVTLSVAGDGPDLDELRGRLASSGVLDIVEFIGRVPETAVHDVMMDHHVLVLPAFYEGFGKVVAEAMSCGCVPVSSRVSGPDEYVEHGRTGFLAEVGAVDEFVDSIGRLFGDQQLWESMSQAARCSAEQTFGMKVSGSRYVGLIRDALDGRYPLAQPRTKLAGVDLSQFSKGDYFPRWIRRPIARLRCRLFKQKSGAGR